MSVNTAPAQPPSGSSFCPACRSWSDRWVRDRNGNPRGCPTCLSLERHRSLSLLLPALGRVAPRREDGLLVVDVAPTTALDPALSRVAGARVLRIDFDPAADQRIVDVRASVTDLPLADGSVDLLLCSHVLEHVPDDAAAMKEIARVLRPDGIALVVVPWRAGPTDEDPSASVEERVRRFGQADHVRQYGDDFTERLRSTALDVLEFVPGDVLPGWTHHLARFAGNERMWLVRPVGGPPLPRPADLAGVAGVELAEALAQAADTARADATARAVAAARVEALEADLRAARQRHERLTRRRAVRALLVVDRLASRGRRAVRRRRGA